MHAINPPFIVIRLSMYLSKYVYPLSVETEGGMLSDILYEELGECRLSFVVADRKLGLRRQYMMYGVS